MAQIEQKVLESVNRPGRIGVLATADRQGRPNLAYFGSPRLTPEGTLVVGLGQNRTLANLEQNPRAVFLALESSPVGFQTPGWRLYLEVEEIQRQGAVLDEVRSFIAEKAGEQAARMIQAGVVFRVEEVRPLVDMG